jgi:hypothetical protein
VHYSSLGRKRRKIQRNNKRNSSADGEDNDEDSNTEILDLICTTRIFESDNVPVRKVRVLVPSDQSCRYLIDDVSSLWGRVGLKFKCGRTVLHGDKTFDELGVESNSEIVVTGGRG